YDGYAYVVHDGVTLTPNLAFSDITTSWSTSYGSAASVTDGGEHWVLAMQRGYSSPSYSGLAIYVANSVTLNSGTTLFVTHPGGTTDRYPRVGGVQVLGGTTALVVFQRDTTTTEANTANSEVMGQLFDAGTSPGIVGGAFLLESFGVGTTYDRETPTVTPM